MATLGEQIWLFLEPLNIALTSVAIVRIVRIGLLRSYPVLATFCLFDVLINLSSFGLFLAGNETVSCSLFSLSAYVSPVFFFFLCPEVFKEIFQRYPGFRPARRRQHMAYAFAGFGAALTAASTVFLSWAKMLECKPAIIVELSLVSSFGCGIFIIGMFRSSSRLRIDTPQNTQTLAFSIATELVLQAVLGALAIYFALRHLTSVIDCLNALQALLSIGTRGLLLRLVQNKSRPVALTNKERLDASHYICRLNELVDRRKKFWQHT